ncbi:MAG TPA: aminomethyltransferase beta-barrel domain-containing protein, partial [Bacillota bacterium]
RKGLGITASEPLYVVEIRPEDNALIVGTADEVLFAGLIAADINWIPFDSISREMTVTAKIRYKSPEARATVRPLDGGQVLVEFDEPQRAVTPGQAVVFYDGDLVLGGGTIERGLRRAELAEAAAKDARATAVVEPATRAV